MTETLSGQSSVWEPRPIYQELAAQESRAFHLAQAGKSEYGNVGFYLPPDVLTAPTAIEQLHELQGLQPAISVSQADSRESGLLDPMRYYDLSLRR